MKYLKSYGVVTIARVTCVKDRQYRIYIIYIVIFFFKKRFYSMFISEQTIVIFIDFK